MHTIIIGCAPPAMHSSSSSSVSLSKVQGNRFSNSPTCLDPSIRSILEAKVENHCSCLSYSYLNIVGPFDENFIYAKQKPHCNLISVYKFSLAGPPPSHTQSDCASPSVQLDPHNMAVVVVGGHCKASSSCVRRRWWWYGIEKNIISISIGALGLKSSSKQSLLLSSSVYNRCSNNRRGRRRRWRGAAAVDGVNRKQTDRQAHCTSEWLTECPPRKKAEYITRPFSTEEPQPNNSNNKYYYYYCICDKKTRPSD